MSEDVKYFDYLKRHGEALEARLGCDALTERISHWRAHGTADPEAVATGCRKIIETMLRTLKVAGDESEELKLVDLIESAESEGFADHGLRLKLDEIRKYV